MTLDEMVKDRDDALKQEAALRALRKLSESIDVRDWNEIREHLTDILRVLSYKEAISVALEQVQQRISGFEHYNASMSEPRVILDQIASNLESDISTMHNISISPDLDNDYENPGANNYVTAVKCLLNSIGTRGSKQSIEYLADAIANAIMSQMDKEWGSKNPATWNAWYHRNDPSTTTKASNLSQVSIMDDPVVVKIEQDSWMDVYIKLAKIFERSNSERTKAGTNLVTTI